MTRFGDDLLHALQETADAVAGAPIGRQHHYLSVEPPGALAGIYVVTLTPDTTDSWRATCRELPELVASGETVEEVLAQAREAMKVAWAARLADGGTAPDGMQEPAQASIHTNPQRLAIAAIDGSPLCRYVGSVAKLVSEGMAPLTPKRSTQRVASRVYQGE